MNYDREEKTRHPCFMKEILYNQLKSIADEEGRTVYDITNKAVELYISLYRSLQDELNYLQLNYLLLKHLRSVKALSINIESITPKDLSFLVSSYISTLSFTEEGKTNRVIAILDFISQLLMGEKANMYSSPEKQIVIYRFEKEKNAEFFKNFSENLIKETISGKGVRYDVKKSNLMIEVYIEENEVYRNRPRE
ncbi:hypothetical protein EWF20_02280 [Sulfolobus sp. S-194]|uniref:hypothetical protein n=1 Tax=Sulfolobus sp. S-194 TaxID=2512240 RepID=UPI001437281A|nr:hypothetical protein [Sulfolobus sp. S-194]QIW23097.1 hypothetical protein EWF20_02280 [Sulfolobus sp. S-194]